MGNAQSNAGTDTDTDTLDQVPDFIDTMLSCKGAAPRAAAARRVQVLCDVGHKQNRVPMVCSGKYDVLTPLAKCLNGRRDERHFAFLALNNLSIPEENKRVMALGPSSKDIIGGLCKNIAKNTQESELCCICLMNISFLEASRKPILQHSPGPNDSYRNIPPLENPGSLLRVIEKLLLTNSPTKPAATSTVRWACGLIKNLAKSEENAALIGQTEIPKCIVDFIRASTTCASRWASNSLEDFSLFVVLNLSEWPGSSRDALRRAGATGVIEPIVAAAEGGGPCNNTIQGLKAAMICAFLDDGTHRYGSSIGGDAAEKAVTELVTNLRTGRGKEGQYAYGVFNLRTAMKAYDIIMPPTNVAGREATDVLVSQLLRDKHARELQDLQDRHESELKRSLRCV